MRCMQQSVLVTAAVLVAFAMSNPSPASAKATPVGHSAKSTSVQTGLPLHNYGTIQSLNGRMAAAEAELARLKSMRQRIVSACNQLPSDVACDSELQAAKVELRGEITRLEQLIATTDQANRTWTTKQITDAEARLDTKIAAAARARAALRAEVNAEIAKINARWRAGVDLGVGGNVVIPDSIDGQVDNGLGLSGEAGLVIERKKSGLTLRGRWGSLKSGDLQGQNFSLAVAGYARLQKGRTLGAGAMVPMGIRLHDNENQRLRYQFDGVTPFLEISKTWDVGGSIDLYPVLRLQVGMPIGTVYYMGEMVGDGPGVNGAFIGATIGGHFGRGPR